MRNRRVVSLVLMSAFGLTACLSTSLKSEWIAPDVKPLELAGKKTLAVFIVGNDSVRRSSEDMLAKEITNRGAVGIPAYRVLAPEDTDKDAIKAKLVAEGFAGAVVMRVMKVDKEISSSPGMYASPYYGSFYGYWGAGWGAAYTVPTVRTDTILSIETTVYSIAQDKLAWAGVSETFNPSDYKTVIRDVATKVSYSMQKAGLVKK